MLQIKTLADYQRYYQKSIEDPETFWSEQANDYLAWSKPWEKVVSSLSFDDEVRWFVGGELNVCYNCVDRHLEQRADQIAILWESDDGSRTEKITYRDLHERVCRFANGLKKLGVARGDRVCIYMPMIPEAAIAMLACARIGAIHTVVFAGFSPEALKSRINDASCSVVITADFNQRCGKNLALKTNVDTIIKDCPSVKNTVVVRYIDEPIKMADSDIWYHELVESVSSDCSIEIMKATDPLFILYTSGSTGKPKGVLHGQAGYLLYATMTFQHVFNYRHGDVFWCAADVGWVTGHSYIVYGPLCSGATTLMYAGTPTYPTPARVWEIVDRYHVNYLYMAPTAIRALMREGDEFVQQGNRSTLKILGSVGEPINPEVWQWYFNVVGEQRCPIVDTWWQTETGGMMIAPIPNVTPLKAVSATWPFFGVLPKVLDEQGEAVPAAKQGNLVIAQPWPGMLQTIYGDSRRFHESYLDPYPG